MCLRVCCIISWYPARSTAYPRYWNIFINTSPTLLFGPLKPGKFGICGHETMYKDGAHANSLRGREGGGVDAVSSSLATSVLVVLNLRAFFF